MDSKTILGLFILFFSRVIVLVSSQNLGSLIAGASGNVANQGIKNDTDPELKCVTKLLPCQPYLHSTSTPPAICCGPMKEIVVQEPACLCSFLNNTAMLNSFNITKDEAVNLAKSCGAKPDVSLCKNAAASPNSSPATPTPASNSTNSSTPNDSGHNKDTANGLFPSLSLGLQVTCVAFLLLSSSF